MADPVFSDAAVPMNTHPLARLLADTVLSVSWSRLDLRVPGSPSPPDNLESPGLLWALCLLRPFSLLVYYVYFVSHGFMGESYGTPAAVSAPF